MRHLFFAAAFVALWPIAAIAQDAAEEPLPEPAQKLFTAMRAASAGECGKAIKLARPLATEKGGLNEMGISLALSTLADCALTTGHKDEAASTIRRATAIDAAPDEVWHDRLRLDLIAESSQQAVETIEAMTQGRGQALNTTDMRWLWQLHRTLKTDGRADLRERLLKVLTHPSYEPAEPLANADGFRLAFAGMLADAGKDDEARALVHDIKAPPQLVSVSLDPRLRGFLSAEPDMKVAWENQLEEARRAARLNPDLLDPVIEVAQALRILGRPAEALKALQATLPLLDMPGAFRDRDEKINWLHDSFGRTYAALGRYDEAVAAFRAGSAMTEQGAPNVSQVINLAYAQVEFGKGDDALKTLAVFDDPARRGSPYGESEMRLARGCAKAAAGRPNDAVAEVTYLREHERDHPEALTDILVCVKDMDGAAAAMIRRLEDPDRRAGALEQLSDFDPPLTDRPRSPIDTGLEALKRRADVKAAIVRAGGTRRFNVQKDEL